MNIVILFGSPNKNGCTEQLMTAFLSECPDCAHVRIFNAYELNIHPCLSCGVCEKSWACSMDGLDDMEVIISALLDCDLLVIATPVYHLSFPAPLKAIIDRTQRCFCAYRHYRNPFVAKKRKAAVLLAAGSPSENGEVIGRQLHWLLPTLNASLAGMEVCANTDAAGVSCEAVGRVIELARKLMESDK